MLFLPLFSLFTSDDNNNDDDDDDYDDDGGGSSSGGGASFRRDVVVFVVVVVVLVLYKHLACMSTIIISQNQSKCNASSVKVNSATSTE